MRVSGDSRASYQGRGCRQHREGLAFPLEDPHPIHLLLITYSHIHIYHGTITHTILSLRLLLEGLWARGCKKKGEWKVGRKEGRYESD